MNKNMTFDRNIRTRFSVLITHTGFSAPFVYLSTRCLKKPMQLGSPNVV